MRQSSALLTTMDALSLQRGYTLARKTNALAGLFAKPQQPDKT